MSVETPVAEASAPASVPSSAATRAPYFTWSLIVLLLLIFGAELLLNLGPADNSLGPTAQTLYLIGAVSRATVLGQGQWWRIFTAPLLHANLLHVLFNCLAFFLVGRRLEPRIGWQWMAAVFAVSAVTGALTSMALNPPEVVGVGASGGIVGVFVVAIFAGTRMPSGRDQTRLMSQATYGLMSAVLPFLHSGSSAAGTLVDYAAHIGGAAGGLLVVGLLVRVWPRSAEQPGQQRVALGIGTAYFGATALSAVAVAAIYSEFLQLDPNLPSNSADLISQANQLVQRYPHDPRIILAQGADLFQKHDLANAEATFRRGLAEGRIIHDLLPGAEAVLQAELAAALHDENKIDEAKAVAAPACPALSAQMLALMQKAELCPKSMVAKRTVEPDTAANDDTNSQAAALQHSPNTGTVDVSGTAPAKQPVDADDASARLSDALAKLRNGDVKAAQAELQMAFAAISDPQGPPTSPVVANNVQALLAVTTYVGGDDTRARNLAAPICGFERQGFYAKLLTDDKLCPPGTAKPVASDAATGEERAAAALPPTTAQTPTAPAPQLARPAAAVTYPDAPSRLLDQARAQLSAGAVGDAKATLHDAIAAEESAGNTAPAVRANIEALLAVALHLDGADAPARDLGQSVCPVETTGLYAKLLRDDKLCP